MPSKEAVLPGRDLEINPGATHAVLGTPQKGPFQEDVLFLQVAMGCFWGAERLFWSRHTVVCTAAGYAGGGTRNPTYQEVCSGLTGHTEVVGIWYKADQCSTESLLKTFWENHDPTQGMRQGNDVGTQYRSAIYPSTTEQMQLAEQTRDSFQAELQAAGHRQITTEIRMDQVFYFAEEYHQQYLHKNPNGYCGIRGTGVSCPIV